MRDSPRSPAPPLTQTGRLLVLFAAFLGWLCSGVQMAVMNLASGPVTEHFLRAGQLTGQPAADPGAVLEPREPRAILPVLGGLPNPTAPAANAPVQQPHIGNLTASERAVLKALSPLWFARYNSLFLLGAALGGLVFGWLGDRAGRVRAMGLSILCYSLFGGLGAYARSPHELLALRFLSGMGVGGMWPTGVALASEAWSDVSRPLLSGLLGTAANVGIVCMGVLAYLVPISHDTWRTALFWTGTPLLLGLLVLARVPESPSWLQARLAQAQGGAPPRILRDLLRPPLLRMTVLGICLGAIPLLGGWGVTAWLIPWSDQVLGAGDPRAKALTSILRAGGGSIGSLFGGWIANLLGRRVTYFLISLVTLLISEFIYFQLAPGQPLFSPMVFVVGGISTIFFGWLPLYLPELFPTHARAAGSGISFNTGRILTALGVLATGAITAAFGGDYAAAGRVTSLIYALGMVVILFAPDTSGRSLGQPSLPAHSPSDSPSRS